MLVYIFTFSISCLFIGLAERIKRNHVKFLLLFLAIIIPSIISGLRAETIGTDVSSYIKQLVYLANSTDHYSSFINYTGTLLNGDQVSRFEKGYMTLVYVCSKISPTLFLNLFISEFLILSLVLWGLCRFKKNKSISLVLGFYTFYALFFNPSLNILRQSIAMAILFLAYTFLIENRYITYIILVFLASLFHQTAAIGFIALLVYLCIKKNNRRYDIVLKNSTSICITQNFITVLLLWLFFIVFFSLLLKPILQMVGLNRLVWSSLLKVQSVSINQLIMRLPFLVLLLLSWRYLKDTSKYFYLFMVLCDIYLAMISGGINSMLRFALYPSLYYVYAIPEELGVNEKNTKLFYIFTFVIYLGFYWYFMFVFKNYNQTFPFKFSNALF